MQLKDGMGMVHIATAPVFLLYLCVLYAAGRETHHHHLYRPHHAPDSCVSGSLSSAFWTEAVEFSGRSLIGTTYALNTIDALQHPKDCKSAKFLLWVPVRHGIGSNIHCLGQALAHALSLDRVLILLRDNGHPFYDTKYCTPEEDYHNCYFVPISNCTIDDARLAAGHCRTDFSGPETGCTPLETGCTPLPEGLPANWIARSKTMRWIPSYHIELLAVSYAGHQLDDLSGVPEILYDWPDRTEPHGQSQARVIKLTGISSDEQEVPKPFHLFLSSSTLRPDKHFYWWRAVSTAYIVRPNKRTLGAIEDRKRKIYPEMSVPHGAIAVHVRQGDKGSESQVIENEKFLKAAEELSVQEGGHWGLSRSIYLSTEDTVTAEYFKSIPHWNVSFTRVKRYHATNISPMRWAEEIGKSTEMLNSLTSLDLALQCDGYVLTLNSNWCRLIDELRATVRCKADHPLLDAQQTLTLGGYDLVWR